MKRKCPTCEGSGDLLVTGRFKWIRTLWHKIVLRHIPCWQCKGTKKIIIDDSTLIDIPDDFPDSYKAINIFLCPNCYDEKVVVFNAIPGEYFEAFSSNEVRARCRRCSFCMPQYKQSGGRAVESVWIPLILCNSFDDTFKLDSNCFGEDDDDEKYLEPNQ